MKRKVFSIEIELWLANKLTITINEATFCFFQSKSFTKLISSVNGKLYWSWSSLTGFKLPR